MTDNTRIYETYYLEHFLKDYSPSTVAWIGAIQTFAQFSATIVAGPVADRHGALVCLWLFRMLPLLEGR